MVNTSQSPLSSLRAQSLPFNINKISIINLDFISRKHLNHIQYPHYLNPPKSLLKSSNFNSQKTSLAQNPPYFLKKAFPQYPAFPCVLIIHKQLFHNDFALSSLQTTSPIILLSKPSQISKIHINSRIIFTQSSYLFYSVL